MVSYGFVALMPALLFPNAIQSQLASSNCESTKAKVSFDLANLASSSASAAGLSECGRFVGQIRYKWLMSRCQELEFDGSLHETHQ